MKKNTLPLKRKEEGLLLFILFLLCSSWTNANDNRILFNRLGVNQGLSSNEVHSILKDKKGFMWFGTSEGLNRFDGYEFIFYKPEMHDYYFSEEYIIDMVETQDEKLWLTYQNEGIRVFNLRENKFYTVEEICYSSNLPLTISHIYPETEGNLLFATTDHRLCKYEYETETIIDYPTDPVAGKVSDVVCKDDYLYVIYYSGIIEILDLKKGQSIKKNSYLQSRVKYRRYHLFVDMDGDLWIYTDPHSELFHFSPVTNRWEHFSTCSAQPLSSPLIREIEEGEDGIIWVATDHGGINLIDKKKKQVRYLKNNHFDARSISQNSVISLYKDNTGVLWAGT